MMRLDKMRPFRSRKAVDIKRLQAVHGLEVGKNTHIEDTVLFCVHESVNESELGLNTQISIGEDCYIGHYTIIDLYPDAVITIGDGCWIGQQCYFNGFAGITLEGCVGVGPQVVILTAQHKVYEDVERPILHASHEFRHVTLGFGSDIGVGAKIIMANIGEGTMIAAGAVVVEDAGSFGIYGGIPALQKGTRGMPGIDLDESGEELKYVKTPIRVKPPVVMCHNCGELHYEGHCKITDGRL